MPAISYQDFSGGLDRRLPIGVQDASRLWQLKNAYITLGKRIKKRPGLDRAATGLAGSFGLTNVNGRLTVFTDRGVAFTPPSIGSLGVDRIELDPPNLLFGSLDRVVQTFNFQGFPYVVAHYTAGSFVHHYVDANPTTYIADANCPATGSATVAASRVFAIKNDVVRYCAAGSARDWTTANDAGFLAVNLQQAVNSDCTAVGTYQSFLVVFFPESAQTWTVAVDPSANQFEKRFEGVGIQDAPNSQAGFANDLAFLSPYGFRTMTVRTVTDSVEDTDVGVPVDPLVVADIAALNDAAGIYGATRSVFSLWVPQLSQYWTFMPLETTTKAWIYSYSKSSKIACWSEYTFPYVLLAATTLSGRLFVRTENEIYFLSETAYTDYGLPIPVEVQMAFQDAKQPGVSKQFYGADYVVAGSPSASFKYDPRDLAKEGIAMTIPGDTRPGDIQGVEMVCSAIAPRFVHEAEEAFELDAISLYYNPLSNFV